MTRWGVLAVLVVPGLAFGCGGDAKKSSMPDVVGERLDVAKSDVSAAGVNEDDIEVVGGGILGVVDESNWTVCDQEPEPGGKIDKVRVIVDRVCGAEDTAEGGAAATSTAPPEPQGEASEQVTVPNAVGMDLQEAQDTFQAVGLRDLTSHDATGQDRSQVLDQNWTVCDQRPEAGARVTPETQADFGAVQDGEDCP